MIDRDRAQDAEALTESAIEDLELAAQGLYAIIKPDTIISVTDATRLIKHEISFIDGALNSLNNVLERLGDPY